MAAQKLKFIQEDAQKGADGITKIRIVMEDSGARVRDYESRVITLNLQQQWLAQPVRSIGESVRIGITRDADRVLRFFERDNPFVSGPRRLNVSAER